MTFYSPIADFKYGMGFALGNMLGNALNTAITGITAPLFAGWGTPFGCYNRYSAPSIFVDYGQSSLPLPATMPMNMTFNFNMPSTNLSPNPFGNFDCSNINFNFAPVGMDSFIPSYNFGTAFQGNGTSGDNYAYLTRTNALRKAKSDSNLEELKGGRRWQISSESFIEDIPFARKGVSKLLDRICDEIGEDLVITSALGTINSPHSKSISRSGASHYNPKNPKLDIGGGLSVDKAKELQRKLKNTGLFSRVEVEVDGTTAHLDVQFKESAFQNV